MILRGLNGDLLEITRRDEVCDDDLPLSINLQFKGFCANTKVVWIARQQWSPFLKDLEGIEKTRQGLASVEAMSPEELLLRFRSIDRAGHMAVDGFVGVQGLHSAKLTFSKMEFDPTELPRVLRELRTL